MLVGQKWNLLIEIFAMSSDKAYGVRVALPYAGLNLFLVSSHLPIGTNILITMSTFYFFLVPLADTSRLCLVLCSHITGLFGLTSRHSGAPDTLMTYFFSAFPLIVDFVSSSKDPGWFGWCGQTCV